MSERGGWCWGACVCVGVVGGGRRWPARDCLCHAQLGTVCVSVCVCVCVCVCVRAWESWVWVKKEREGERAAACIMVVVKKKGTEEGTRWRIKEGCICANEID